MGEPAAFEEHALPHTQCSSVLAFESVGIGRISIVGGRFWHVFNWRISYQQVAGPRVLHGLLAALTDVWVAKLARVVLDDASSKGIVDRAVTSVSVRVRVVNPSNHQGL